MRETTFAKTLRLAKTHRIESFVKLHSREMKPLLPFTDYLYKLCGEKRLEPVDVCKAAQIEENYGRQIFRNIRYPSRDVIIKLAFGFNLDIDETQELLKAAREAVLNGDNDRDYIISFALIHGYKISDLQILLEEYLFPALGDERNGGRSIHGRVSGKNAKLAGTDNKPL